jgi:hypothetical protein
MGAIGNIRKALDIYEDLFGENHDSSEILVNMLQVRNREIYITMFLNLLW